MSDPKRTIQPEAVMADIVDIPALRALLEKATKGPWRYDADCAGVETLKGYEVAGFVSEEDGFLIVAAVNALSALLSELEGLREAVAERAEGWMLPAPPAEPEQAAGDAGLPEPRRGDTHTPPPPPLRRGRSSRGFSRARKLPTARPMTRTRTPMRLNAAPAPFSP